MFRIGGSCPSWINRPAGVISRSRTDTVPDVIHDAAQPAAAEPPGATRRPGVTASGAASAGHGTTSMTNCCTAGGGPCCEWLCESNPNPRYVCRPARLNEPSPYIGPHGHCTNW